MASLKRNRKKDDEWAELEEQAERAAQGIRHFRNVMIEAINDLFRRVAALEGKDTHEKIVMEEDGKS